MLSDVCLSVCPTTVAYIGPKSRTDRPRKTKIDTEVAHVTRDSDTTFKVKRSKVKVTRPLYSGQAAAALSPPVKRLVVTFALQCASVSTFPVDSVFLRRILRVHVTVQQ